MDWAVRRQFLFALGVFLFLAALVAGGWYFFIYTPPTCADGVMNQGEFGPDCEGPCAKLCTVPRVDALWSRSIQVSEGVYHGVALVKNPLATGAATGLTYSLSVYDVGNILIAERRGVLDLYAGETRAVFEANIVTGARVPVRAFMKIDGGSWTKGEAVVSPIRIVAQQLTEETRVLTATIENTTALPVEDIVADALLYDVNNILVTASETKIALLPARGRQEITFTWAVPFSADVARADVQLRIAK